MTHAKTCGWTGRALFVDLSTGAFEARALSPDLLARELGGRGLGGSFLGASLGAKSSGTADAASPADAEAPIVVAAGPLTGTGAPGTDFCHVTTRSPLTGVVGDASLGGRLGGELKRAGFDALVITGRAAGLCGIEIADGEASMVPADGLAGLSVPDAFTLLRQRHAHGALAVTGPAADDDDSGRACAFATLTCDLYHVAARCGVGRAFGIKRLKYLAVRGSGEIAVAEADGLAHAREDILRLVGASPALMGAHGLSRFGAGALFDLMDARRMMPTDNFARTHFDAAPRLNAHAYVRRHHPLPRGCESCPVACLRLSADGRPLPEFDAMSHFSALIGNEMLELVMRANDFCSCLGIDPISAASALACHREITGEPLDPERVLALLLGMAVGQGAEAVAGRELSAGAARFAASRGRPELAMAVKGLDLPAMDPRGAYGLALAYAVATHGGSSLRADPTSHEVLRKPVAMDRFSFAGKARGVKLAEDVAAAADSLCLCPRLLLAAGLEEYGKAVGAATGLPLSGADLAASGARMDYRERLMNAAWGFAAADDDLPPRFFAEAGSSAPDLPVPPLPRGDFLAERAAYYRIRGLTPDGLPKPEIAAALGLAWPEGLARPTANAAPVAACGPACDPTARLAARYADKLAHAGLCAPGEPLFAVQNAEVRFSREGDARQAVAGAVVRELGAAALLLAEPVGARGAAMLALAEDAFAAGESAVTPGDCETRTFLHDLPVVHGLDARAVAAALAHRKGCIVLEGGRALMAAAGSVSPEQPFVTASSMAFACLVAYFSRHLRDLRAGAVMTPQRLARFAAIRALLEAEAAARPEADPELTAGPFMDETAARAAMVEAGRLVVDRGLVDSTFGNVSCRVSPPAGATPSDDSLAAMDVWTADAVYDAAPEPPGSGDLLLISQTGGALDELSGVIDACRFDGATTVGLTASSELVAHRAIYDGGPARTILHGHPPFSVILSMDCPKLDCPGLGQCHRACAEARGLTTDSGVFVPIVPGEVGAGRYGLCHTLPPALTEADGRPAAIVYGHGLFATGARDFRDAFATLSGVERFCRAEYFRRVDGLTLRGPALSGLATGSGAK